MTHITDAIDRDADRLLLPRHPEVGLVDQEDRPAPRDLERSGLRGREPLREAQGLRGDRGIHAAEKGLREREAVIRGVRFAARRERLAIDDRLTGERGPEEELLGDEKPVGVGARSGFVALLGRKERNDLRKKGRSNRPLVPLRGEERVRAVQKVGVAGQGAPERGSDGEERRRRQTWGRDRRLLGADRPPVPARC